jgi:hypothetical protein
MKLYIFLFGIITLIFSETCAQKIPSVRLNSFFTYAYGQVSAGKTDQTPVTFMAPGNEIISGAGYAIRKLHSLMDFRLPEGAGGGDTLVIGMPPLDSLIITGNYTHTGPVLVVGNGILRFKHAHSTIVGDVWVVGEHATITSDSSYLYFPQEYFYQRSMVIVQKGNVEYNHTTLDFSGLSHNLFVADSGRIKMDHVKDIGFTTCGLAGTPEVDIKYSNEPSEYVITDRARLTFSHDTTLLLWHQVPDTGIMNITFPHGDTLSAYHFNAATPGVSGIHYSIDADNCSNVMWALMPANGSHVSVSDSKIRSVGLWFLGNDTVQISGLVDNSDYNSYTADLPDRYLHFENSGVQTWSLYPMDAVTLNVTGCILGEIGTERRSQLAADGIFVDGSGGYWWSTDTTFMVGAFSTGVNAIRSAGQSIFLFGYSTLNSGDASSMGNSILMLIQSQLPDDPKMYDGSCIWDAFIGKTSLAIVDTTVIISGSAWIDKTPASHLMGLAWYRLYYQHLPDTAWIPIQNKVTVGKHDEVLGSWDTHGLAPGAYLIKLVICDNTTDSNKAEALKSVNLLPKILGIPDNEQNPIIASISPNPVTKSSLLTIQTPLMKNLGLTIIDRAGKVVYNSEIKISEGKGMVRIGELNLIPGEYSCILSTGISKRIVNFINR